MHSKISGGIEIQVETSYQEAYSNPAERQFTFAYRITIVNGNVFPVQLMRRHWLITDGSTECREVEGEGVVGVQPQIQPGDRYQYISACHLRHEIGKMQGAYTLKNLHNHKTFQVVIPEFQLVVPTLLN